MQLPVDAQSVTIQYGSYLEELHEFFTLAKLPFGSPEDVDEFTGRLSEPGPFPENVSALIWSILFQEREQISASALANLLAVAVGGPTVEDDAGKMEGPLRVLTGFVIGAMRSRRNMPPEELPSVETDVRQVDRAEKPAVLRRDSEFTRALFAASQREPLNSETGGHPATRLQPEGNHAPALRTDGAHPPLFAKWSETIMRDYDEKPHAFARPWKLAGSIVLGLVAVAAAILVVRSGLLRSKAAEPATARGAVVPGVRSNASQAAWCMNATLSPGSRDDLEGRYKAAKTLSDQNRPSEALPRLQEVALVDPGFPMINLNISEAWLKLKQIDEAKAALDAQYAVSSCLAKLPDAGLTSYCSSEFPNSTLDACRTRIAGIWQAAHTQGALLQLASRENGGGPAALAGKTRTPARPSNLAADASANRKASAGEPRTSRRSSDRSLVDGEGTDASLGAYPKQ